MLELLIFPLFFHVPHLYTKVYLLQSNKCYYLKQFFLHFLHIDKPELKFIIVITIVISFSKYNAMNSGAISFICKNKPDCTITITIYARLKLTIMKLNVYIKIKKIIIIIIIRPKKLFVCCNLTNPRKNYNSAKRPMILFTAFSFLSFFFLIM